MKALVFGVEGMFGVSTKSGTPKPYDFGKVFIGVPVEPGTMGTCTLVGFGFKPMEMPAERACFAQFAAYQGKFPVMLDLDTDVEPFMGELRTTVVGIKVAVSAVPAVKVA